MVDWWWLIIAVFGGATIGAFFVGSTMMSSISREWGERCMRCSYRKHAEQEKE